MPIYEITKAEIRQLEATNFTREGLSERYDLQRLLNLNIEIIAPGTLIIAEEFCQWEDGRRRIDNAQTSLMNHINDARFGRDVRIVLVSADFSKEITTSVLWLNEREVDITCVKLRPWRLDDRVLLDVQQVIPLPEASTYTVQMKQKAEEDRARKKWNMNFGKYDLTLGGEIVQTLTKRALVFETVKFAIQRGAAPDEIARLVPPSKWLSVEGDVPAEQFWSVVEQTNPKAGQYSPSGIFARMANYSDSTAAPGLSAISGVSIQSRSSMNSRESFPR